MKLYIVGNDIFPKDLSAPLISEILKKQFPQALIIHIDPTEDFIPEEKSLIIDTVIGTDIPRLFTSLDDFVEFKSSSVHDYDLYLHLSLLIKTGRIKNICILGLPKIQNIEEIVDDVVSLIRKYETSNY